MEIISQNGLFFVQSELGSAIQIPNTQPNLGIQDGWICVEGSDGLWHPIKQQQTSSPVVHQTNTYPQPSPPMQNVIHQPVQNNIRQPQPVRLGAGGHVPQQHQMHQVATNKYQQSIAHTGQQQAYDNRMGSAMVGNRFQHNESAHTRATSNRSGNGWEPAAPKRNDSKAWFERLNEEHAKPQDEDLAEKYKSEMKFIDNVLKLLKGETIKSLSMNVKDWHTFTTTLVNKDKSTLSRIVLRLQETVMDDLHALVHGIGKENTEVNDFIENIEEVTLRLDNQYKGNRMKNDITIETYLNIYEQVGNLPVYKLAADNRKPRPPIFYYLENLKNDTNGDVNEQNAVYRYTNYLMTAFSNLLLKHVLHLDIVMDNIVEEWDDLAKLSFDNEIGFTSRDLTYIGHVLESVFVTETTESLLESEEPEDESATSITHVRNMLNINVEASELGLTPDPHVFSAPESTHMVTSITHPELYDKLLQIFKDDDDSATTGNQSKTVAFMRFTDIDYLVALGSNDEFILINSPNTVV